MRKNKYGIKGLKGVQLERGFVYFWTPPLSLLQAGIFRTKTLRTNFDVAAAKARALNTEVDAHRSMTRTSKRTLGHRRADDCNLSAS